MEELLKALGPWPTLQGLALGLVIAAIAGWAIRRGMQDSRRRDEPDIEEEIRQREAYGHLKDLAEGISELIDLSRKLNENIVAHHAALNRILDTRWNRHQ